MGTGDREQELGGSWGDTGIMKDSGFQRETCGLRGRLWSLERMDGLPRPTE